MDVMWQSPFRRFHGPTKHVNTRYQRYWSERVNSSSDPLALECVHIIRETKPHVRASSFATENTKAIIRVREMGSFFMDHYISTTFSHNL